MPVTFFMFKVSLDFFIVIVLNAKPKQNDIASARNKNVGLFILNEYLQDYPFNFTRITKESQVMYNIWWI